MRDISVVQYAVSMTPEMSSRRAILTRSTAGIAAVLAYDLSARQNDETEVRQVIVAFAAAWSRHDVQGMGALHTEDVNFTNIWGSWKQGHKAIEQGFASGHATVFSQSKMVIETEQVRLPSPSTAVAHSTMELLNVPSAFGGKCHSIRVLVKRNGNWLISDFQNTQIRQPPR